MFRKKTGIERCKKQKKLDMFVKGVFVYIIAFVVIAWVTYWIKGDIPDTLVQVGLGGSVLELAFTAAIEILSNKKG
jgi:hypothetical protein